MTVKELYEFAKSINAENAEIRINDYDDTDTFCGDTACIHTTFCVEDEKDVVYIEPKGDKLK